MPTDITTIEPLTPQSQAGPYLIEDYFNLSGDERYELLYGRLYMAPSPNTRHQTIIGLIYESFIAEARKVGSRVFISPIDVVLSDNSVVQPDIVYISPERRSIIKDYIEGAPDLVVEVLSPGTARRDKSEKLRLYAASDIREYWIVDPVSQHIEFLINHEGSYHVELPEDDRYISSLYPYITIDLARFWQDLETMEA